VAVGGPSWPATCVSLHVEVQLPPDVVLTHSAHSTPVTAEGPVAQPAAVVTAHKIGRAARQFRPHATTHQVVLLGAQVLDYPGEVLGAVHLALPVSCRAACRAVRTLADTLSAATGLIPVYFLTLCHTVAGSLVPNTIGASGCGRAVLASYMGRCCACGSAVATRCGVEALGPFDTCHRRGPCSATCRSCDSTQDRAGSKTVQAPRNNTPSCAAWCSGPGLSWGGFRGCAPCSTR
jgi:hypothetical protein